MSMKRCAIGETRSAAKPDRRAALLWRLNRPGDQFGSRHLRGDSPSRVGPGQGVAASRIVARRLMSMDPERWQRLKSILIDAFEEESADARQSFVERSG